MDHIIEHEGDPIQDLSTISEQSGSKSAPMDVDENDEDLDTLQGLVKGGNVAGSADAEAKARLPMTSSSHLTTYYKIRVSNARNAVKPSRTPLSRISMQKKADMTNSKNRQRR